jgi:hypothetical protein
VSGRLSDPHEPEEPRSHEPPIDETASDEVGGDEARVDVSGIDESLVEAPPVHPLVAFTDEDLAILLKRAAWITVVLGGIAGLVIALGMGWRNAVLFLVGAAISALSILEWGRLIKLFNASLDQGKTPRGAGLVVGLFLVRLVIFAGVIYGSLKCFQGSPIVLVCGLALALVGLVWEALRLLRG